MFIAFFPQKIFLFCYIVNFLIVKLFFFLRISSFSLKKLFHPFNSCKLFNSLHLSAFLTFLHHSFAVVVIPSNLAILHQFSGDNVGSAIFCYIVGSNTKYSSLIHLFFIIIIFFRMNEFFLNNFSLLVMRKKTQKS